MADSTTAVSVAAIDPNPTLNTPDPSPTPVTLYPNPNPVSIPPPAQSILTPLQASFIPGTQQFSAVTYQTPPPGVIMASASPAPPQIPMMAPPYAIAGQPVRYAAPPMPNGYPAMPPPGVLRYPSPYGPVLRPGFPPRPMIGVMPQLARPPIFGVRGPILPPTVRPAAIPMITPVDKPQTTVYIGKISTTVDNEFMRSLLELCGPVKNWKRPQDPTGTLKGFGFCEFESAEGVLRALRLLSKLSIDGQELMVNVNQATRQYLERFVEKKSESLMKSEEVEKDTQNEEPTTGGADTTEIVKSSEEPLKLPLDDQKKDVENSNKEDLDTGSFGLVNNEDREADHEALGKLRQMLEERLKSRPLPPPPPPPQVPVDGSGNSNSDHSESKDIESEEIAKNDSEDKTEDDKAGESGLSNGNNRNEPASPDRSRRYERPRHRDGEPKRDRDRELELERDERDRLQKIAKKDKDREYKSREDERRYKNREKEWENREREREHWRKREREREKEKAQERKWEVIDQENDNDDSHSKKRKHKVSDEDRKRRQREKEDDISDRLREEEEIAEAKMKAEEEQQRKLQEALNVISGQPANGLEKVALPNETTSMEHDKANDDQIFDHKPSRGLVEGEVVLPDGVSNEPVASLNNNAPTKKLGFGLSGTGKRAAVPSLFMADEDEDAHKDKKMRPLVPIDYSTEEQQQPAEQPFAAELSFSNVVAATEFVKHISKEDVEKDRGSRRSHERSTQRDRKEDTYNSSRKDDRDRSSKKPEIPKILDAKQLIDTIPKTRDELFTYDINWTIYDQNSLHDRMRPWISKKITEFLGEEEVTLVDYIVSSTQEHVNAGEMLERLQTILDDEAEMFVLKMWRMLIFEIKKVETGLTPKLKS